MAAECLCFSLPFYFCFTTCETLEREEAADLTEQTVDIGWTNDVSVVSKHYGCRMIEMVITVIKHVFGKCRATNMTNQTIATKRRVHQICT